MTAQQLVQLLQRQTQLLLEKQGLSEEVERLRSQVQRAHTPRAGRGHLGRFALQCTRRGLHFNWQLISQEGGPEDWLGHSLDPGKGGYSVGLSSRGS